MKYRLIQHFIWVITVSQRMHLGVTSIHIPGFQIGVCKRIFFFLISQPKNMLWVLIRWPFWTQIPIRFSNLTEFSYHLKFEQPKYMFKLMGKKIITILRKKVLLNWPYDIQRDKQLSYLQISVTTFHRPRHDNFFFFNEKLRNIFYLRSKHFSISFLHN